MVCPRSKNEFIERMYIELSEEVVTKEHLPNKLKLF